MMMLLLLEGYSAFQDMRTRDSYASWNGLG